MKPKLPTFGSQWKHHSGRVYTVFGVANIGNVNLKYPLVVVYIGRNGYIWTKPVNDFYKTMVELI